MPLVTRAPRKPLTCKPQPEAMARSSAIRGVKELVAAMALTTSETRLNLIGEFSEQNLKTEVEMMPGWSGVRAEGFLSRDGVAQVLARSIAGLVTRHPRPAYLEALPIKMFEYMSVGVPVIASDFPLWRDIVEASSCGV